MQTLEKRQVNLVKTLSVDLGNRFCKWLGKNGTLHKIPSHIYKLPEYQDSPTKLDDRSVFLEFANGDRIVIGQVARDFEGSTPVYQLDKSEVAELLLAATIAPVDGSKLPLEIELLKICLPDSRDKKQRANLEALAGTTRTLVRNGKPFTYSINEVELWDEGEGAFRYAQHAKMFQYPSRLNAIVDCGGGTFLAKIFNSNGTIDRTADIKLPGTYQLAQQISAYLLPQIGESPNLSLIMDGIGNGKFQYGATDTNFKAEFLQCQEKWTDSIKLKIKESWQKFFPNLGEVLLTGGSAPLLTALSNNPNSRFKLAPDYQFINVKGMNLEG